MPLIVKILPQIRNDFEMAATEQAYATRLVELFKGSVDTVKRARDDWIAAHHPPYHKWITYNNIALEEVTRDWLPSERKQARAIVTLTLDKE